MNTPLVLEGMQGLGDNLYQRGVLAGYSKGLDIYLRTPWPQLYNDLGIRCLRPATRLRTQQKNAARLDSKFVREPLRSVRQRWHYPQDDRSILEGLRIGLGASQFVIDMTGPDFGRICPVDGDYVVVRPVTVREEWRAESRNPLPEYVSSAAAAAQRAGLKVVSVADLEQKKEWLVGDPVPADIRFEHGELQVEQLMSLIRGARGVIGGVGWIAPACIAYRTPLFLIYGGWGKSNGPQRIFGPLIDSSNVEQVIPDEFCPCNSRDHFCCKTIEGFEPRAEQWIRKIGHLETAPGGAPPLVPADRNRILPGAVVSV